MIRKFSLYTLFIALTILCVVVAWLGTELRRSNIEQTHLSELRRRGFSVNVSYDFQFDSEGYLNRLKYPKESLFTSFFDKMAFTHVQDIAIERDDLVQLNDIAELELYHFSKLEHVTLLLPTAKSLEGLEDLPRLKSFGGYLLGDVTSFDVLADTTIETLLLTDAANLSELTFLKEMKSLKTLRIEDCPNLGNISLGIKNEQLSSINLRDCDGLESISNLPRNLFELNVEDCDSLLSIFDLPDNLSKLDISGCGSLLSISDMPSNISELIICDCSSLLSISNLPNTLSELFLQDCDNLLSISDIPINPSTVYVFNCPMIKQIDKLRKIEGAQVFNGERSNNLTGEGDSP